MAALQAALKALTEHEFPFEDLPADRLDPLWPDIAKECQLTLVQLSALKNERCKQGPPPTPNAAATPASASAIHATTAAVATTAAATTAAATTATTTTTTTLTISIPAESKESKAETSKSTTAPLEYDDDTLQGCGDSFQGYLLKSGNGLLGSAYKRRFFLLSNQIVQYFADDTRNVLKGEIFLRPESEIHKVTTGATNPFAFNLTPVRGGRIYHFAGKDATDRDRWISAIRAAISHCETARQALCLVDGNLRKLHQKRRDDDLPPMSPALRQQVSSLSHGTLLIKCKGDWEEQEWRIDDGKLCFPEAGIRYSLDGVQFKIMPEAEHGPLVLGLKRKTDGHGLLLKSQTRPRLKRLIMALRAHSTYIGDNLSDVDEDEI